MPETGWTRHGLWGAVFVWIILLGAFLLFVPFYRRADRKPAGLFLAFSATFALEMCGLPLSLYMVKWIFEPRLPQIMLGEHPFSGWFGGVGHYLFLMTLTAGGALIVAGWARIRGGYWSPQDEGGRLVRDGIYRHVRHPQYAGFLVISIGMLCKGATILLVSLWPFLAFLYLRLARREEAELLRGFGDEWQDYSSRTGMFLPRIRSGDHTSF